MEDAHLHTHTHAPTLVERITRSIGSVTSLVVHTFIFVGFFTFSLTGVLTWDLMFLILTTIVSLEAIYLAIFIQMSVNRQEQSLREVEKDVDEIQKDVDEIQEDVEDISEDVEDIQEDVDEIQKDVDEIQEDVEDIQEEEDDDTPEERERKHKQLAALEQLSNDVQRVLRDIETLKAKR